MINNNDIMKKLRVALKLKDTDIIDILKLAEFETTPSELSAIFRREDHPHYMACGDQILRRFLDGLIIRNRGKMEKPPMTMKPQPKWIKCKPLATKKITGTQYSLLPARQT
jgi:uncharacterized protein YehS (DUF1456 family)